MVRVMIGNHDGSMQRRMAEIVRKQSGCRVIGTYDNGERIHRMQ